MNDSSNKTNRGKLFRNDKRESDKHPEFTASFTYRSNIRINAYIKFDIYLNHALDNLILQ